MFHRHNAYGKINSGIKFEWNIGNARLNYEFDVLILCERIVFEYDFWIIWNDFKCYFVIYCFENDQIYISYIKLNEKTCVFIEMRSETINKCGCANLNVLFSEKTKLIFLSFIHIQRECTTNFLQITEYKNTHDLFVRQINQYYSNINIFSLNVLCSL